MKQLCLSNNCDHVSMKVKSEKCSADCSHHHDHIAGPKDSGVQFKIEQRLYETDKSLEFHSLSSLPWNFYFQLHRLWVTGLVSTVSPLQSSQKDTHVQPKEQEGSWEKFLLVHTGCNLGTETFANKDIEDSASSHVEWLKRCSTSLVIREMQIKATRYHSTSTGIAKIQRKEQRAEPDL